MSLSKAPPPKGHTMQFKYLWLNGGPVLDPDCGSLPQRNDPPLHPSQLSPCPDCHWVMSAAMWSGFEQMSTHFYSFYTLTLTFLSKFLHFYSSQRSVDLNSRAEGAEFRGRALLAPHGVWGINYGPILYFHVFELFYVYFYSISWKKVPSSLNILNCENLFLKWPIFSPFSLCWHR